MAAKAYDPVTSIEGMFNGCITRVAQAIKDPVHFGPSTKGVLLECSKRFQDALDDCEVQILEAKFYLENQLAQNQARREAKAREEGATTTKRKHDQIQDPEEKAENAKRVKIEGQKQPDPGKPEEQPKPIKAQEPQHSKPEPEPEPEPPEQPRQPTPEPVETSKPESPKVPDEPPAKSPEKPPEKPPEEPVSQTLVMTDFPQPTPNATPAPTNDEFNFESMFGDPSADAGAGEGDMAFDLNLGDDFGNVLDGTNDANPQDQDLNSLLPGLDEYANQAADDGGDMAIKINSDLPALPDIGPNDFDAFLDANDFNTDGSMNLNDDPTSNLENLDGIDFDSMF